MLEKFLEFREKNNLPGNDNHILLAVSGGIDSVVMTHLYYMAGYNCIVAHCNFQMRGAESDQDEIFAEKLAAHYRFSFHTVKFDTEKFAADNGLSIQQSARLLRYEWFYHLAEKTGCSAIATAHHAGDLAETMLINLTRGTGLSGLHGIPVVNGKIIRPMLFAERGDIEKFAAENKLNWRDDSSNREDDYTRNKIRHHVIPVLNEINPKAIRNMNRFALTVRNHELLMEHLLSDVEYKLVSVHYEGAVKTLSIKDLSSYPDPAYLLFMLLEKYGFNESTCTDVFASGRSGAEFHAQGYRLVRDREELVLFDEKAIADNNTYVIEDTSFVVNLFSGNVLFEKIKWDNSGFQNEPADFRDKNTAWLDVSKLSFPLKIRRWRTGDLFCPFGMHGNKLISDFLTDEKISVAEKELIYLLLSGEEVVWVIGYRPDNRFRITGETAHVLKCTFVTNKGD